MEGDLNPTVSVIIPFCNAPHLNRAIRSILDQTFHDFELILVDNASDDGTSEIAKEYAIRDKRITLISEARKGVVWAMNSGIEAARGAFIARMDADDYSFPERLQWQLSEFTSDPSLGLVSGQVDYVGSNEGFRLYVDWMNEIVDENDIRQNQFVEFPIANPSFMIKRSLFEKIGRFKEGDFPEDYEFFLRLQSLDVKMSKVKEVLIKWYDLPTRLTRTDARYATDAFYRVKAKYLAKWLKKHNPHHPKVLIWGAGRLSRRRSDYLLKYGIDIVCYIDLKIKPGVIHFEDIPDKDTSFIVSYVANRGARDEIRAFLTSRNYLEFRHFILAS